MNFELLLSTLLSTCFSNFFRSPSPILQFKRTLPPKEPLLSISLLLLDSDELVVRIAEAYFLNAAKNKSIRAAVSV